MHFDRLRRREFITLLGGGAAWPLTARSQQQTIPVVGFLSGRSSSESASAVAAFREGMKEAGYIEGQTITVEYLWADGQYDQLPALAAAFVRRQTAVIVTAGGSASALAAKSATATIPIVFDVTADPVKLGLVASLSRPSGNATGVTNLSATLEAKRLGLLRDLVPGAGIIAALLNPDDPATETVTKDLMTAARTIGQQLLILNANSEHEVEGVFATLVKQRAAALLVIAEPFFISRREKIVGLAARHSIPAIYGLRAFVTAGGLMSYGVDVADIYRQLAIYTGRILKGAKPTDLPVMSPRGSRWSSTSKLPRRSGSKSPTTCSRLPTR
jgi:putative tryptophan/tyrosine transport system substrate-binding protein